MAIEFQSIVSSFKLKNQSKIADFIQLVAYLELNETGHIQYIFCNDKYLLGLNKQYLKHDTLTDIITFDYSEKIRGVEPELTADIFISVERVGENAEKFKEPFNRELMRVIIHGVLHLCGYKDKLPKDKKKMRTKEDYYLALFEKGEGK